MKKEVIVNAIGGIIATIAVGIGAKIIENKTTFKIINIPLWLLVSILTWAFFTTFKAIKLRNILGNVKHAKIAIVSYSFSSSFFFDDLLREIIDTCNTNNLNLELKLPVNDFNDSEFKKLLKKTLDEEKEFSSAILITSNLDGNFEALKDFETKFKKPIVILDVGNGKLVNSFSDRVSVIGFCNKTGGQKAALIAQNLLEKKDNENNKVFVIGATLQSERQDYFVREMHKSFSSINIKINEKGMFNRKIARKIAYNYLKSNSDVDLVFCTNDEMALGVLDAVEMFKTNDFKNLKIIGYDGIEEVIDEINTCESNIKNTILQNRKHLAQTSVEYIIKKIENKPVLKEFIIEPEIFVTI